MTQISASIQDEMVETIKAIAEKERRSFSQMIDILLDEAVAKRKEHENEPTKVA